MAHKRHYNFDDFQRFRAKRNVEANRNAFLKNAIQTFPIRQRRQLSDVEHAYNKYYERIRAKYRNYVQNLLGYNKMRPLQEMQVQDGKWQTTDPESISRNRVAQNSRTGANDFEEEHTTKPPRSPKSKVNKSRIKSKAQPPIVIPNINEESTYKYDFHDTPETNMSNNVGENDIYSNYFPPPLTGRSHTNWQFASEITPKVQIRSDPYSLYATLSHNFTYTGRKPASTPVLMQNLHSQIIRRKRNTVEVSVSSAEDTRRSQKNNRKNAGATANQTDPTGMDGDPTKKIKFKGPCEPLSSEAHAQLEIVRPGKDPNEAFGPGTIVRMTCSKGYVSNMASPNATSKCVRGRWKPIKPTCNMSKYSC